MARMRDPYAAGWNDCAEAAAEKLGGWVLDLHDNERVADGLGDVSAAARWRVKKYAISDALEMVRSLTKPDTQRDLAAYVNDARERMARSGE
jgi:hypothetical protein